MDNDEIDVGYMLDEDDAREMQIERNEEIAESCTCGAIGITKEGNLFYVADCCCGAG